MLRIALFGALALALFCGAASAQTPVSQICQASVTVAPSTATDTVVVAPVAGRNIFVCGVEGSSSGTTNFYLESATAASCGGTLTQIGTEYYTAADWIKPSVPFPATVSAGMGNGLCVHTTGAVAISLTVWYGQYP